MPLKNQVVREDFYSHEKTMTMPLRLFVLGVNHRTAPLAVREQLSFSRVKLQDALSRLKCCRDVEGGAILSTCNRSEIYITSRSPLFNGEHIKQFIGDVHRIDPGDFAGSFYSLENKAVIEHLYRVSSGLDSQLLGENEILGQVKHAYDEARSAMVSDPLLERVFDGAIKMGRKVRRETAINRGITSLSSMAIKLAQKKADLQHRTILLVGVNKINEQIAQYLRERGIRTVIVANRTYDKAAAIAQYLGGRAIHFDEFKRELHQVDIIISSTAAPHVILRKDEVESSMEKRKRPLLIIDMAVPRDVEPDTGTLEDVTLYSLEDFNQIIEENLGRKRQEAHKAEGLIRQALAKIDLNELSIQ